MTLRLTLTPLALLQLSQLAKGEHALTFDATVPQGYATVCLTCQQSFMDALEADALPCVVTR